MLRVSAGSGLDFISLVVARHAMDRPGPLVAALKGMLVASLFQAQNLLPCQLRSLCSTLFDSYYYQPL
jgi:hypothetical protein